MNSFGPAAPQAQDRRFRSRATRWSTLPPSSHSNGWPHICTPQSVKLCCLLGMVGPDIERMAADVRAVDGLPRYVWTGDTSRPAQLRTDDSGVDCGASAVAGAVRSG